MESEFITPKHETEGNSKRIRFSSSILECYRSDKKMQSPYKSNNPKRSLKTSNDLKRLK